MRSRVSPQSRPAPVVPAAHAGVTSTSAGGAVIVMGTVISFVVAVRLEEDVLGVGLEVRLVLARRDVRDVDPLPGRLCLAKGRPFP